MESREQDPGGVPACLPASGLLEKENFPSKRGDLLEAVGVGAPGRGVGGGGGEVGLEADCVRHTQGAVSHWRLKQGRRSQ